MDRAPESRRKDEEQEQNQSEGMIDRQRSVPTDKQKSGRHKTEKLGRRARSRARSNRAGPGVKASGPRGRGSPGPPLPRPFSGDLCQRPERGRGLSIAEAELQRSARWGRGLSAGPALAASARARCAVRALCGELGAQPGAPREEGSGSRRGQPRRVWGTAPAPHTQ